MVMLAIVAAFFLGASIFSLRVLPNISVYVELVKYLTILVLVFVGLYFCLTTGRKLYRTITHLHKKENRKRKLEEQFAMIKTEKQFGGMHWQEFEQYIGYLFRNQGYDVVVTRAQNDEGIDAVLKKDGKTYVVQAKRYKPQNIVGRPEVQAFVGAMVGYDGGIFVTTSDYSYGAKEYAKGIFLLQLINGAELLKMVEEINGKQFSQSATL